MHLSSSTFETNRLVRFIAPLPGRGMAAATSRRKQFSAADSPARGLRTTRIAFAVLDLAGPRSVPKYDQLIRGVSNAALRFGLDLQMSFMSDLDKASSRLTTPNFGGLILHGTCPPASMCESLYAVPTVWLMGNPRRPHWGDQVMPDNAAVGRLAANYLLERGHRRLMYFGLRSSWSFAARSLAFQQTAEDSGADVSILSTRVESVDRVVADDLDSALYA